MAIDPGMVQRAEEQAEADRLAYWAELAALTDKHVGMDTETMVLMMARAIGVLIATLPAEAPTEHLFNAIISNINAGNKAAWDNADPLAKMPAMGRA